MTRHIGVPHSRDRKSLSIGVAIMTFSGWTEPRRSVATIADAISQRMAIMTQAFDFDAWCAGLDWELLNTSEGRRTLTRLDPMLFMLVYLPHHLTSDETGNQITWAEPHLEWFADMLDWVVPVRTPRDGRHAYVAPRSTGKSTMWFLGGPLWAAAHGHRKFIAAFAHAAEQAQKHLQTLKGELDTNKLLRADFPDLCAKKPTGRAGIDTQSMYQARSGFVFAAHGIDSSTLGMKVGQHRPDLLIFDDVEPDEANYSGELAKKRLGTIQDAVLPLNEYARVVLVGTVTMAGSLVHQLVRTVTEPDEPIPDWITEQKFHVHYHAPILQNADGSERSTWPEKWPLEYLLSIRHTRSYKKNYANDPMGAGGDYWTPDDFVYEDLSCTRYLLSIDPSTTTGKNSDPCGIAVIGWRPERSAINPTGRCVVEHAEEVRLVGEELRSHVLRILGRFPLIRLVLVESNQGGEHWHSILHHLPAGIVLRTVHNTEPKEVRAEWLLNRYQVRPAGVVHRDRIPRLEEQMVGFPRAAHDDMIDGVGNGVRRFLDPPKPKKAGVRRTESYAG